MSFFGRSQRDIDTQLAVLSEQRKLCAAVAGTDICVRGGPFACSCNRCREEMSALMCTVKNALDDIFQYESGKTL
jgi:hypothetical protein